MNVSEVVLSESPNEVPDVCDVCKTRIAVGDCSDCFQNVCGSCCHKCCKASAIESAEHYMGVGETVRSLVL